MAKESRPILITLLAILYILGALALIGIAIAFFVVGGSQLTDIFSGDALTEVQDFLSKIGLTWEEFTVGFGVVFLILGLIYFVVAVGLLKGWSLFWYIGIIVNIIALISGIYTLVSASAESSILGIVWNALIVIYMLTPGVRRFFLE